VVAPQLKSTKRANEEALQVTEGKPHRLYNWLILGKQLGKSATSTVFEITTMPKYVIKYQVACTSYIDDLTREYYYLKKVESLGIAPKAVYLSRATVVKNLSDVFVLEDGGRIVGSKTRKLNVDFTGWGECAEAQVRFMIMEKVGDSIEKVLEKPVGLVEALETGAQMIELIGKLHRAGFVHRDVHPGNFARGLGGTKSLYLIDYGLSGHASSVDSDEIQSTWFERLEMSPLALFHHHLSPWEMMGYLSSYRDDFVRTLGLIGAMMHGHDDYMEGNHEVTKKSIGEAEMSLFGKKPKTRFSIMKRKIHEILSGKGNDTPLTLVQRECGASSPAINKMRDLVDTLAKINMKLDESVYAVPNYSRIVKLLKSTAYAVEQCNLPFVPILE